MHQQAAFQQCTTLDYSCTPRPTDLHVVQARPDGQVCGAGLLPANEGSVLRCGAWGEARTMQHGVRKGRARPSEHAKAVLPQGRPPLPAALLQILGSSVGSSLSMAAVHRCSLPRRVNNTASCTAAGNCCRAVPGSLLSPRNAPSSQGIATSSIICCSSITDAVLNLMLNFKPISSTHPGTRPAPPVLQPAQPPSQLPPRGWKI